MVTQGPSGAEAKGQTNRTFVLALGCLGLLYLLTRLWAILALPVFLDEAVHIQWAERLYGEGRIGRPIGAGRLLAVAAYGLALPFDDRLLVARLIAVAAGALALACIALLSRRLFGSRAGLVAGLLYILSPFALVYDRLALSDGFLSAAIIGLMLAAWRVVSHPESGSARLWLAVMVVLSILSKVSALLFFVPLPLVLLALPSAQRRPALRAFSTGVVAGLAFALPVLLFFASNGGEIAANHIASFAAGGREIVATLGDMREWLLGYFRPAPLLFGLVSLLLLRSGRALWLAGSVVVPLILFAVFSRPWSARYVLPALPPLLVLIAGGIEAMTVRFGPTARGPVAFSLAILVSLSGLPFTRQLLLDPSQAPFPSDDRHQLVSGWPSGYGVRELSLRLRNEARNGPITVFVDTGGTRTVSTSLAILLSDQPGILLEEGDFATAEARSRMLKEASGKQVFAILGPRTPDLELPSLLEGAVVDRLEVYQRPGGEWAATLFRIRAEPRPAADAP